MHKSISALAKVGLIAKVKNAKYDGYRLTYGGLDYLSLNTHRKSDAVFSLGNQIGVGKESDIYVVASPGGRKLVLKIHRLGRISFRTVKANRDYLRNRNAGSWMYLSRLAAQKEYAFMQVLYREGFPVPEPIAQSRHTLVMDFIDSFPLRQIEEVADPAALYSDLMDMIVRLARVGLIHGDYNEFNILIREEAVQPTVATQDDLPLDPSGTEQTQTALKYKLLHNTTAEEQSSGRVRLVPILIDFPQMLSTTHVNAKYYFDRDVNCIKRFFARRFKYEPDEEDDGPHFEDAVKGNEGVRRLDIEVEATGFSRKAAKELEKYIEAVGMNEGEDAERAEAEGEVYEERGDYDDEGGVEGEEEHDLQDGGTGEAFEIPKLQDDNVDDEKVIGEMSELRLQEDKEETTLAKQEEVPDLDDGMVPVEVVRERDVAQQQKKQSRKKKAGWAI